MRILINVQIPHEPFNTMNREGTAAPAIRSILEELKPEVAYFYDQDGCRGGTLVVHIDDPSQLPSIAEPFFMKFEAHCDFHIAMTPEDLERSSLEELGRQWG